MKLTRREYIKANAAVATAAAAGVTLTGGVKEAAAAPGDIRWDKAACRFCGTGCSVLIGTKDDRIVATQGDVALDETPIGDATETDVAIGQDPVIEVEVEEAVQPATQ